MSSTTDKFTGNWALVPELCQYQDGHPPVDGSYSISTDGDTVSLSLKWTDEHGKSHNLDHGGRIDGSVQVLNNGKIEASYTRVDSQRLDSSMYSGGRETSYSHRKTSNDGALMVVMIEHHHLTEPSTRNFQVYRRVS